jgi:serine/threonine-protein kinase
VTTSRFGDRYAATRELGRGGAATVWLAHDEHLDREVAVKVLRKEFAFALGHDRFLREIRFASQLRHPHIVPVLDFGESDGQLWYVMPYIAGGSLRQRMDRESQLRIDDTVRWGAEMADALAYAHEQGIVHRDVKPENVLLDGDHAWLADFGIARAIDAATADTLTSAGIAIGTPAYMSPEQASGGRELDGRSDVYSLACVLYECLAGIPPFVGPTPQSVIAQRFAHAPHPVASYRSTVPVAVQDVIEHALHVVPADRLEAREMLELLRAESTSETRVPGRRSSASLPVSTAAAALRGTTTGIAHPATRRRTLIAASVAVVAVALLAWRVLTAVPTLDSNKVVVYPLTVTGGADVQQTVSAIPTLIGSALEGVPPLRWVEGDALIGQAEGTSARDRNAELVRASRDAGAGYFIDGTVISARDTVTVVMRLVNASRDSVVARAGLSAASATADAPSMALQAVGQLLPRLIEPGRRVDVSALIQRNPKAIAEFMLGERDFRKSRYPDALAHYQEALARDSNLAVAALKAARTARSLFREADASRFVALALARDSLLPGANAPFARGLSYFYRHVGDSAIAALQQAITLAPDWSEAFAAIGDVYFYVGIDGIDSDSAATANYRRARQIDSVFTPAMYHLALLAARRHDPQSTRAWVREYQRGESPDTLFVRAMEYGAACQAGEMTAERWQQAAAANAESLVILGKVLAGSAADVPCARAAFAAVFAKGGQASRDHFGALLGLNAIAVAADDRAGLSALASHPMAVSLRMRNLLVLDALAGAPVDSLASTAAAEMLRERDRLGPTELWLLGAWLARERSLEPLMSVTNQLRASIARSAAPGDTDIVESLVARERLLRADTAGAVRRLAKVNTMASFQKIEWGLYDARAADNVLLSRVALARKQASAARDYAARVDQPNAITNVVFLRQSLQLRLDAARLAHDAPQEASITRRMTTLVQQGVGNERK